MSTYWGFRCEQCNEDSPTWFNHGRHILREILELWDSIRVIRQSKNLDVVSQMSVHDEPSPFEFIEHHAGHRIVWRNEYGDIVEPEPVFPALTASKERDESDKLK